MKRIIAFSILILTQNSCIFFPPGAPHGHTFKSIDNPNPNVRVSIGCTKGKKRFLISGLEKKDSLYISSNKIKNDSNFYLSKNYSNDSTKFYYLQVGDYYFHRKILNDTLKIKVVKPNLDSSTYKFLIVKDRYIKN